MKRQRIESPSPLTYGRTDAEGEQSPPALPDPAIEHERRKYVNAFKDPGYRRANHGLTLWHMWQFAHIGEQPRTFLDIGCGNGRLFAECNQKGIDAWGLDFVNALDPDHLYPQKLLQACLWDLGMDYRSRFAPFEFGVCADVMEHIPPEKVDAVFANICPLVNHILFKIANFPSRHDGNELHLTLQPANWWQDKLNRYGTTVRLEHYERERVPEYVIDWKRA